MATQHHHARPRTAPSWAARGVTAARRIEARAETHWALVAYTTVTLALIGYVLAQLAPLA